MIKTYDSLIYIKDIDIEAIETLFSKNFPVEFNENRVGDYIIHKDIRNTVFYEGNGVEFYNDCINKNYNLGVISDLEEKCIALISYKYFNN